MDFQKSAFISFISSKLYKVGTQNILWQSQIGFSIKNYLSKTMLEACQITLKIKGIERGYAIKCEVFKWALIGLFLFNFFPFKQRYRKNASCVGFQTWIVCVEGEHADHSANTTTAQHFLYSSTPLLPNKRNLLYSSDVVCGPNRLKFA